MGLGDPTNPIGGLLSGFVTGFANQMAQGITQKAEEKRQKLAQEAKFLNEVLNDTAGQYSQADRDAAIFALAELSKGDKPGAGLKSFEKRRKELMDQQVALASGKVAGGGAVAGVGSPAEEAQPVIGGASPQVGGPPPSAPQSQTPGRPAEYRPGGAPGAPPPVQSAALPAASPTVPGAGPVGAPPVGPQVSRETPQGGPQAPAGGPIAPDGGGGAAGAAGGPPSVQEVEEFGRGMGLTPPQRPTPPQQPDPYTARKLDLEFYKQDMLQYKTDQQAYTEWFERVALQMRQERKQKETQDFQAREAEKERGFKGSESAKDRTSREKAAALRGAGRQDPGDKQADAIRRQAIATYHRELNDIEDAKDDFGVGRLGEKEKQARRERAASNYRAATGEDPPDKTGVGYLEPPGGKGEKSGKVKPGGPPPAVEQTLDELPGGGQIRSRIEDARRKKVDPKKICADIAQLPASHQAAAKVYARCP